MILDRVLGAAAAAALALSAAACAPPKYYAAQPCDRPDLSGCVVEKVGVTGAKKVPESDIEEKIATAETSHGLFGLLGAIENVPILSIADRLTVDYEKLDNFVLERDLARIERLYRARGYYEAHARAARVRKSGNRARVEIVVEEGDPINVGNVKMQVKWVAEKDATKQQLAAQEKVGAQAKRRAERALPKGQPFAEASFEEAKKRIARAFTDNAYAYATVEAKATVDLVAHRADVMVTVDPGPRTTFGRISIEGAGDLPENRLMQAIAIKEGEDYSAAKLESAQIALADLRVLGSIDVVPQLSQGADRVTAVPVVFRVAPTALKTVKLGVGFEIGSRVAARGLASWENQNFFGGLRNFIIEGRPGVVFFPLTATSLFNGTPTNFELVPEMRIHAALTQPGFIEARTRGLISADVNLYQLQPTSTLSYLEFAGKTGVERDFWGGRVHVGLFGSTQVLVPIQAFKIVEEYDVLVLPYVQSIGTLDLRRGFDGKPDPVNPHSGFYLSNDVQVAFGASRDIRVRPEVRGYIPISKRVTLAMRLVAGFLHVFGGDFARNPTPATPFEATESNANCRSSRKQEGLDRCRWIQLMQLRGFNSGGPNSNRGYIFNGVGPQEPVPGVSPVDVNGAYLPMATGGQALWEASVELRFPIYEKIGATIFVDGSDVRRKLADFGAPFAPHLSTGIGLRYGTPIGPIRLDLGLRIPGLQVIGANYRCGIYDPSLAAGAAICQPGLRVPTGGGFLDPIYGQAGTIRGVPLTVSIAFGEAY